MAGRTRAGSRVERFRVAGHGRVSDKKIAWLRTQATNQLAILALDPKEHDEENDVTMNSEAGTSYLLVIPVPGRNRAHVWNLTGMTTEELEATRQFFNHLFNLADPIIRERDKVAKDAFSKGDDSFSRVYRALPQFVVRKRKERANDKGLHNGLESLPSGDGDRRDSSE